MKWIVSCLVVIAFAAIVTANEDAPNPWTEDHIEAKLKASNDVAVWNRALEQATAQKRDLVTWIGDATCLHCERVNWKAIHIHMTSFDGDSTPRARISCYRDGMLVPCGYIYGPFDAEALTRKLDSCKAPAPQPVYYSQPAYYQQVYSEQQCVGGG